MLVAKSVQLLSNIQSNVRGKILRFLGAGGGGFRYTTPDLRTSTSLPGNDLNLLCSGKSLLRRENTLNNDATTRCLGLCYRDSKSPAHISMSPSEVQSNLVIRIIFSTCMPPIIGDDESSSKNSTCCPAESWWQLRTKSILITKFDCN